MSTPGIEPPQESRTIETPPPGMGRSRCGATARRSCSGTSCCPPPSGTKLTGIYHKADPAAGLRGAIAGVRRDCEAVYLVGKWPSGIGGRSSLFATSRRVTSATGVVARNGGHPHTKPDDVMGALVDLTKGTIADPFMGSGSTLRAAKDRGRRAIGVELDERYCELAARRLGQEALDFGGAA